MKKIISLFIVALMIFCALMIPTFAQEVLEEDVENIDESIEEKAVYYVNVDENSENGTVIATPTEAEEGESVTLTFTPDDGYSLDTLFCYGEEELSIGDMIANAEFANAEKDKVTELNTLTLKMPASDLNVSAIFKEGYAVYFRVPNAEIWDEEYTRLMYQIPGEKSVMPCAATKIVVGGEVLYRFAIPSNAEKFFFQNYLTGMPQDYIPGGKALYSIWNMPEKNKVYEFVESEVNPAIPTEQVKPTETQSEAIDIQTEATDTQLKNDEGEEFNVVVTLIIIFGVIAIVGVGGVGLYLGIRGKKKK